MLEAAYRNAPGVEGEWGLARPLTRRRRALDALERLGAHGRFARRHYEPDLAGPALAEIVAHADGLAAAADLFADDHHGSCCWRSWSRACWASTTPACR